MFTEYEAESILAIPEVSKANQELKKEFCKKEAPYLEISDHDFFSLVMMAPTLGVALANDSISFFEERALNKKARKLSKGGYFMKKDPVVFAMKFLIKNFDSWKDQFYGFLKNCIEASFNYEGITKEEFAEEKEVTYNEYKLEVLKQPYILIRFIASFFLEDEDEIISDHRAIGKKEYTVMRQIASDVGLSGIPVFHMFCKTFDVKG